MQTIKTLFLVGLTSLGSLCMAQNAAVGYWKTVDDKTGKIKAIVKVEEQADGSLSGTIVKHYKYPDIPFIEKCTDCPAPYTNKPVLGLKVLTGLKPEADDTNSLEGGKIIDPASGRIYSAKAKIMASGQKMQVRGFLGLSLLGRTQVWLKSNSAE